MPSACGSDNDSQQFDIAGISVFIGAAHVAKIVINNSYGIFIIRVLTPNVATNCHYAC